MSAALPRLKVEPIPAGPNPPPVEPTAEGASDPVSDLLNRTGENGEGGAVAIPPASDGSAESPAEREDRLEHERFERDRDAAFSGPPRGPYGPPQPRPEGAYSPRDRDALDRLTRGPPN